MTREDVGAALAAMDRALGEPPECVYDDMVRATRALVALRDRLISEKRDGEAKAGSRLARLNAILSIVVAAEYPLEGVRRDRIKAARGELAALRE